MASIDTFERTAASIRPASSGERSGPTKNPDETSMICRCAGSRDIFTTTAKGLDDGSEYTPDAKTIFFNSNRTGKMQVWRMNADGSEQTQVTDDEFNNWFPLVSPDGKTIVFISFPPETRSDR